MFGIDWTIVIYTAIIVITSIVAGFGIGYSIEMLRNREIIKVLQEQVCDNIDLEEKVKKVLERMIMINEEDSLKNIELVKKMAKVVEEIKYCNGQALEKILNFSAETSSNILSKLDTKIAELIEEAQHIEKNKDKDINHFYG